MAIQLLVRLVDENHPVIRQAKRTTTIFVHATAHTEPRRRQTFRCAVVPMPDPACGILRSVFVPEQAMSAGLQFGKVDAGCDGFGGAERLSFWR
ncbi:hypothetical protein D3C87_1833290 [compost metagenome]